jgi:hypothetical protein
MAADPVFADHLNGSQAGFAAQSAWTEQKVDSLLDSTLSSLPQLLPSFSVPTTVQSAS